MLADQTPIVLAGAEKTPVSPEPHAKEYNWAASDKENLSKQFHTVIVTSTFKQLTSPALP